MSHRPPRVAQRQHTATPYFSFFISFLLCELIFCSRKCSYIFLAICGSAAADVFGRLFSCTRKLKSSSGRGMAVTTIRCWSGHHGLVPFMCVGGKIPQAEDRRRHPRHPTHPTQNLCHRSPTRSALQCRWAQRVRQNNFHSIKSFKSLLALISIAHVSFLQHDAVLVGSHGVQSTRLRSDCFGLLLSRLGARVH